MYTIMVINKGRMRTIDIGERVARIIRKQPGYRHGRLCHGSLQLSDTGGWRWYESVQGYWMDASLADINDAALLRAIAGDSGRVGETAPPGATTSSEAW
jgi:hypothetical protein